jgi:paraquat-inducible protein A
LQFTREEYFIAPGTPGVENFLVDEASQADLKDLIVCPHCDALFQVHTPDNGERAVCHRCHTVLIAPRRHAGLSVIALALTVMILVISATVFPFLRISVAGLSNSMSLLEAAFAFSSGPLVILALVVLALIVLIPLARVILILYVLVPVVANRGPPRGARAAFRLSEELKPWSMAEIFAIGCAVALVKIGDLADIHFGPAFWMFAALVVVAVLQDRFMCRWSIWKSLETPARS